jgi:hypothetical protein
MMSSNGFWKVALALAIAIPTAFGADAVATAFHALNHGKQ